MKKTLSKKIISSTIDDWLGPFLADYGFSQESNGVYKRNRSDGFDKVVVMIFDFHVEYKIDFSLSLRWECFQEIADKFSNLPKDLIEKNITVSFVLSDLMRRREQSERVIYNDFDLVNILEYFECYMVDEGLAYFESYRNINVLDKVINDSPDTKCIYVLDIYNRVVYGLIAARLSNRRNYAGLVNKYKKLYVNKWTDVGDDVVVRKVDELIEYLGGIKT